MATAERQTEILESVERLQKEWDQWADDPMSPEAIEEDSTLEAAIQNAIDVCGTGDVPSACRELVDAVSRFAMEHANYRGGDFDRMTLAPWRKHAAAFAAVCRAHAGALQPRKTIVESVQLLRSQKDSSGRGVPDWQIAEIYGCRASGKWVGPFFSPNEEVLGHLISQEADKPGSIIGPNFVHPQDAEAERQRTSEVAGRLNRLQQKANEDKPRKFTDEDVLNYLREGAFAHQAADVYQITLAEVHRIARDGNIVLENANEYLMATPSTAEAGKIVNEESQNNDASSEKLKAKVLSMAGKSSPADIRSAIKAEFRADVSIQQITAIIREDRSRKDAEEKLARDATMGRDAGANTLKPAAV